MQQARTHLEPYYKDLADASEGPETFPSFRAFCQLPSVRTLWVPEDAVVTPELWTNLQPALASDIKKADRPLRVMYARRVLSNLETGGLDFDKGLRRSLAAPAGVITSYNYASMYPLDFTTAVDQDYRFESTEPNFNDLAPDVTDAQLDDLLNRFLNQHRCGAEACRVFLPFPAIHTHMRTSCGSDNFDDGVGPSSNPSSRSSTPSAVQRTCRITSARSTRSVPSVRSSPVTTAQRYSPMNTTQLCGGEVLFRSFGRQSCRISLLTSW